MGPAYLPAKLTSNLSSQRCHLWWIPFPSPPVCVPVTLQHCMVILVRMHSVFSRPKLSESEKTSVCLFSTQHQAMNLWCVGPLQSPIQPIQFHSIATIPQSYWTEACLTLSTQSSASEDGWVSSKQFTVTESEHILRAFPSQRPFHCELHLK